MMGGEIRATFGAEPSKKHKNILQIGDKLNHIVPHSFRPKIPEGGVDFTPLEIRPIISSGGGVKYGGLVWFGWFCRFGFPPNPGEKKGGNMDLNFERLFPGYAGLFVTPPSWEHTVGFSTMDNIWSLPLHLHYTQSWGRWERYGRRHKIKHFYRQFFSFIPEALNQSVEGVKGE